METPRQLASQSVNQIHTCKLLVFYLSDSRISRPINPYLERNGRDGLRLRWTQPTMNDMADTAVINCTNTDQTPKTVSTDEDFITNSALPTYMHGELVVDVNRFWSLVPHLKDLDELNSDR